ncbi:45 kDa calcium-binding protein-like [Ptychodera flava]|uniref:45 kDa calcium-binding protein-like n=1 Tax=Ptychodera flava TaxID=63121 RepID=UPI00396A1DF9
MTSRITSASCQWPSIQTRWNLLQLNTRTYLFVAVLIVSFLQGPSGKPINDTKLSKIAKDKSLKEDDTQLLLKNDRDNVLPRERDEEKPFPPDHIEGVKLERDGHLNKEFNKEVFLGNEHKDFDDISRDEGNQRLKDIFAQADTNANNQLSLLELTEWISQKTREHYEEAKEESEKIFPRFDPNKDGKITWNEYRIHFLKERGYDDPVIAKAAEGDENIELHEDDDYDLYRDQDRWQQADEDEDNCLTPPEFLAFKHPEHCRGMLRLLVSEILHDLDQDGDSVLSLIEFVSLPIGHEGELERMAKEDEWVRERKEVFEKTIDSDKDGRVTVEELEAYMDPKSLHNAESEARHLLGVADLNEDGQLSLKEVLVNYDFFVGSKMFNYAKSVHDEF